MHLIFRLSNVLFFICFCFFINYFMRCMHMYKYIFTCLFFFLFWLDDSFIIKELYCRDTRVVYLDFCSRTWSHRLEPEHCDLCGPQGESSCYGHKHWGERKNIVCTCSEEPHLYGLYIIYLLLCIYILNTIIHYIYYHQTIT